MRKSLVHRDFYRNIVALPLLAGNEV